MGHQSLKDFPAFWPSLTRSLPSPLSTSHMTSSYLWSGNTLEPLYLESKQGT